MTQKLDIEALYESHRKRVLLFINRKVRNESISEDLTQQTFLEAFLCQDNFHGDSKPSTWLFGIALNMTRNYFRKQKDSIIDFNEGESFFEAECNNPLPQDILSFRQTISLLEKALAKMPKSQLHAIELVADSMSYEETAKELNVPIGTIRSRISRAREQLRATCGIEK